MYLVKGKVRSDRGAIIIEEIINQSPHRPQRLLDHRVAEVLHRRELIHQPVLSCALRWMIESLTQLQLRSTELKWPVGILQQGHDPIYHLTTRQRSLGVDPRPQRIIVIVHQRIIPHSITYTAQQHRTVELLPT